MISRKVTIAFLNLRFAFTYTFALTPNSRQHRYSHINDLDSFLTVMGGIPNNILSNNSPGVEIRSYIRPSEDPTRNKYANLTSSHLHLFRSQQFVSVIPEEVGVVATGVYGADGGISQLLSLYTIIRAEKARLIWNL